VVKVVFSVLVVFALIIYYLIKRRIKWISATGRVTAVWVSGIGSDKMKYIRYEYKFPVLPSDPTIKDFQVADAILPLESPIKKDDEVSIRISSKNYSISELSSSGGDHLRRFSLNV
jgi:hypothetical protein